MIEHSITIAELCKGLHGAQGVLTGVVKDGKNPAFKSRYASLEAVLDTVRPALQANGLAVTQAPGRIVDGALEVTTMLIHTSGEWWKATTHVPLVKRDPQGMGSATTYGLRYALMAALGVPPTDDDDGERAMPPRQQGGGEIRVTSGGKPVEPSSSQRAAQEMMAQLWKVSGAQVAELSASNGFRGMWKLLEAEDRTRVQALAEERKAIQ